MATKSKAPAADKYELLTNKLLTLMEQGVKPWQKSWYGNPCQNLISGHKYQGVNPLLCSIEMLVNGWQHPYFLTYRQASEAGLQVRRGSRACWLKWGGTYSVEDKETGDVEFRRASKWHDVFNIEQCEGENLETLIESVSKISIINPDERIAKADEFIKAQGSKVTHMGDRAFYVPSTDEIAVPHFENFTSAIAYYSTLAHEHIHWTGHNKRLARDMSGSFGSQSYAFEELVAELGAVFTCNELGMEYELENHANYLNNWIAVLKGDNKAFMKAAGLARRATELLLENAGIKQEIEHPQVA